MSLAGVLLSSVQEGESLKALCFQQDVVPILMMKESMVMAEKEKSLPRSYGDLEVGQVVPGVEQIIKSYGVFIRLSSGGTDLVSGGEGGGWNR